ncbi:hypothetical protein ACZ90_27460 [Streptomyces albus subsp. albus]|nr:hypothetical protein ACZ90_27460 [Streptomyces albus subsp. albus]
MDEAADPFAAGGPYGVGEYTGVDQRRALPPRTRGQRVRDVLLWALLTVPVMFGDWFARSVRPPWWQTGGGLLLLAVAVACSRRFPVAALLLVGGLGLAASPSLFTLSYGPSLAVVGYLLGRRAQAPRPALLAFTALAVTGTALVPQRAEEVVVVWLAMLATLLFGAVFPWLIGRHRRQDRALVVAGWGRAVQLEREQQIVADRARLRERARIAQDMHDSLGHDLALIALRAGALQIAPGLDPAHRSAARELRAAASDATERLGEIIGVLRDATGTDGVRGEVGADGVPLAAGAASRDGAPGAEGAAPGDGTWSAAGAAPGRGAAPAGARPAAGALLAEGAALRDGARSAAGVAPEVGAPLGKGGGPGPLSDPVEAPLVPAGESIEALVERAADSGLPVRWAHGPGAASGTPRLAPMAERTAYRVVQESLTNAAKHAPGAAVTVAVTEEPARPGRGPETVVRVVTRAAGGAPGAPRNAPGGRGPGSGTGLLGLRERVRLVGGVFSAESRDGGFEVTARLPHAPAGTDAPAPAATGHTATPAGAAETAGRTADPARAFGRTPGARTAAASGAAAAARPGPRAPESGPDPGPAPGSEPAPEPGPGPLAAREFARARRATRQGLVRSVAVAGTAGVLVVAGAIGWYAYTRTHAVLAPRDYAALRVGEPYRQVERVLPELVASDPPSENAPPEPAGADCRYYRASDELFVSVDHFRLCFRAGRLVSKAVIPRAGVTQVVDEERREWVR